MPPSNGWAKQVLDGQICVGYLCFALCEEDGADKWTVGKERGEVFCPACSPHALAHGFSFAQEKPMNNR